VVVASTIECAFFHNIVLQFQRHYALFSAEASYKKDASDKHFGIKLSASMSPSTPEDIHAMHSIPYLQAVGALMYLAMATRPDISYAVGVLARFNKNPGLQHWKAVKHLFHYLKGTLDFKLTYAPTPSCQRLA
jgi:hypothetical protein